MNLSMKVGLLSYYLSSKHSGQSRFLVNLAKGLKSIDVKPVIYSLYIDNEQLELLKRQNIQAFRAGGVPTSSYNFQIMRYGNTLASKLADLVTEHDECDSYVVLADEALPAVEGLGTVTKAYLTNGDLSLMLLNHDFQKSHKLMAKILGLSFVRDVARHARMAAKFDLIMANSYFTAGIMSFIYGLPINRVVYPPVDGSLFNRQTKERKINSEYAIALIRNPSDPLYRIVTELAREIRIKIVGGGVVNGAENLGFVTDNELVGLYSAATLNLSPNPLEFYGYSIVESMSCGTPTVAFDNGGAKELIKQGINGWLVSDDNELRDKVKDVMAHGYSENIRNNCLTESQKFSIKSSAKSLVSHLKLVSR